MSPLLTLVKVLTSLYQSSKLNDQVLTNEIIETYNNLNIETSNLFPEDKKTEIGVRQTIDWLTSQPKDEPIIKSNLIQRVNDFVKDSPELKESINVGLEDYNSEERTKQIIFKHLEEVKKAKANDDFDKEFKKKIKDFYFNSTNNQNKEKWIQLAELIESKINSVFDMDNANEVVNSIDTDNPTTMLDTINQSKLEKSEGGILKTGWQGLNNALAPDYGLRRSKFYLFEALTNRGKSLAIGHITASIGLYNKPMLRNKSKIPTILLESAEETLDLILEKMYKIILLNKHGILESNWGDAEPEEIANVISEAFKENGWCLKINQVIPTEDNVGKMINRIRKLELQGYEIIFWAYDYLAMADTLGCAGFSSAEKLHDLVRRVRVFIVSRGICYCTPWQLNPAAKQWLRESDDDSELNFAKEVGGKSMTEGSTKVTNEADAVVCIHVAKTSDDKAYFSLFVGKVRSEGGPLSERFCIYNIDPKAGLKHDVLGKPQYRKSFKHILDTNGNSVSDWDDFETPT